MKLPSGTEIYANNGIIGIGPELTTVFEGYDGQIDELDPNKQNYDDDIPHTNTLSKQDRLAIAEIMIKRWMDYRDLVLRQ
jgi:hypothetical protein